MGLITKELSDKTKKLKQPCNECPYSKSVTPGALGGSDPEVYIGQGHGPFWLPCHKNCDFSDPNWKENYEVQQCAGAAIYRANTERDSIMPDSLLKLPKSDKVFESPEELYAHHKGISIEEAQEFLKCNTPDRLMVLEFLKIKTK
jgi:hypothetical protein